MISDQKAYKYFVEMQSSRPNLLFNKINQSERGLPFVLIYISEHKNCYANTIADQMNISRARIGKLVENLERKGLVCKIQSTKDARIHQLSLTNKGETFVKKFTRDACYKIAKVVEAVGEEKFQNFVETLKIIKKVVDATC